MEVPLFSNYYSLIIDSKNCGINLFPIKSDKMSLGELNILNKEVLSLKELQQNKGSFQISSFIYKSIISESKKMSLHINELTEEFKNDESNISENPKFLEINSIKKQKIFYFLMFTLITLIQVILLLFYAFRIYSKYQSTIIFSFLICFIIQTTLWILSNIIIWLVFFHNMLYFNEIRSLFMCEGVIFIIMILIFMNFIFSIIHSYSLEIDDFHEEKQKLYIILLVLLILILIFLMFFRFTHSLKNQIEKVFK